MKLGKKFTKGSVRLGEIRFDEVDKFKHPEVMIAGSWEKVEKI